MKAALLSVLALAGVCAVAASPAPPSWGLQTYIKAEMKLPYAGIVEAFEAWQDGNKMSVSYYGGLDRYVFRGDTNETYQLNPTSLDAQHPKSCFKTDGPVSLNPYLPDTTGFVLQGDAVQVNGVMCADWQRTVSTLNKTSVYDMYVDFNTGAPVRYQMMGYDSLIGSHYDLYQLDYISVVEGTGGFPAGVFDPPAANCGGFPGPGASHMNPNAEVSMYYPGSSDSSYAEFMDDHGKSYDSAEEQRTRELEFHKNRHFVLSHQRRFRVGKESYTVGLNFLADHLPEELAARRGRLHSQSKKHAARPSNGAIRYHLREYLDADLPTSVDWRQRGAVNPPQDQGICGSCWSFGSTGAIEGAYFIKYGSLKVMAEQQLMDCSWKQGNNACDGGEDYRAYDWILQNKGMSFKEHYGPYLMQDSICNQTAPLDVSLQSFVNVTAFDETALMDALVSQGPISVSIDASHPGLSFYTGGVYFDPACKNDLNSLDHSVLAVGYGTDDNGEDYWIVKNSWSTYWGVDGFIKMSRKDNNCGVASAPTYVVLN